MSPYEYIDEKIENHIHDGNFALRVNFPDLFLYTEPVNVQSATIATTGNTDTYLIAPRNMNLSKVFFSGTTALAADNSNYITWTITNLGQAGAGTAVMLATLPAGVNTTKATGGTAIGANSKVTLLVANSTVILGSQLGPINALQVIQGDRLLIRAAVTGTLANTISFPVYMLIFN